MIWPRESPQNPVCGVGVIHPAKLTNVSVLRGSNLYRFDVPGERLLHTAIVTGLTNDNFR